MAAEMADDMAARAVAASGSAPLGPPWRPRAVRAYDFRRPDKFSKEHLRALRNLHESYARLLASSVASYVRTSVQVRLVEFEQLPYADYLHTLPSPTVLYIVGMSPLPGQALLHLDLPMARSLLERLLGGPGGPSSRRGELTEIELAILRTLGNTLLGPLAEAWTPVHPLHIASKDLTLTPEFVQVALPGEVTIALRFEITVFDISAALSLCIPHPVLQPALDRLAEQVWSSASTAGGAERALLNAIGPLAAVQLPIVAELGETTLTTREVLELAPGQIIKLRTAANGPVTVRVSGQPKFAARPGIAGRNLAVQIVATLT